MKIGLMPHLSCAMAHLGASLQCLYSHPDRIILSTYKVADTEGSIGMRIWQMRLDALEEGTRFPFLRAFVRCFTEALNRRFPASSGYHVCRGETLAGFGDLFF